MVGTKYFIWMQIYLTIKPNLYSNLTCNSIFWRKLLKVELKNPIHQCLKPYSINMLYHLFHFFQIWNFKASLYMLLQHYIYNISSNKRGRQQYMAFVIFIQAIVCNVILEFKRSTLVLNLSNGNGTIKMSHTHSWTHTYSNFNIALNRGLNA